MNALPRLFAILFIFLIATAAWLGLGGAMYARSNEQESSLRGNVADLWGQPLAQKAPAMEFQWIKLVDREERIVGEQGKVTTRKTVEKETVKEAKIPASSRIQVDLALDQRRKGLMWFPLYDVRFEGRWSYLHESEHEGWLNIYFAFPTSEGMYDDFRFQVDGQEKADLVNAAQGAIAVPVFVRPGQKVEFTVGYRSRGMKEWSYRPTEGAGQVEDFELVMNTDFEKIDFPSLTMSPSTRDRVAGGWKLEWAFKRVVTGNGIGMVMPERVQPGPLGARMSLTAPISLGFFIVWIYVIGLLKKVEVHPMNHLFLAAAFFAFHLLFGYTADHLDVEWAFGISSVVSVFLVVTYLRLVAGSRFAFIEAGLAQLLYLVGFSLAHFWEGFTGLTVTVLGIVTLFLLMQLTGRVRWAEVFTGKKEQNPS